MMKLTVICGDGRGKTSCAIGYLYRKICEMKKITVAQFLKTGKDCGECIYFKGFLGIRWHYIGINSFYKEQDKHVFEEVIKNGFRILKSELEREKTDFLLLDEAGIALHFDLIKWEELNFIFQYVNEEVIITGRKVPDVVFQEANLSFKIKEIKHPYQQNIQARKGIDY